ncbi:MAG: hypothetical protein NTX03_09225 [Bacteroidetes bacterium]|nr:hypothetical protein [Bacteroidota bacterium]
MKISNAQSLTYTDLVNLQKSDIDKAKGFCIYKGFNWYSSEKNNGVLEYNGYEVNYDRVIWNHNSEYIYYLSRPSYENAIFYYTNESTFSRIEFEAKGKLKKDESGTATNRIYSSYTGQNLEITFNAYKVKDNYSQKIVYLICVNSPDVKKIISQLCSNCKGKGQVIEHEKCTYCNGDGKENCDQCSGNGKTYCGYCKEGKIQCNSCYGKGDYQCNVCYGQGKFQCSQCYGQGKFSCNDCYGKGELTCNKCDGTGQVGEVGQYTGKTYYHLCQTCTGRGKAACRNCRGEGILKCENCKGKGTLKCENCSAKGTLTCSTCSGKGKITCQNCNGNYSTICSKCSGTGNTDLVCSHCDGKGISNEEIKKVCSVCNGSKLINSTK